MLHVRFDIGLLIEGLLNLPVDAFDVGYALLAGFNVFRGCLVLGCLWLLGDILRCWLFVALRDDVVVFTHVGVVLLLYSFFSSSVGRFTPVHWLEAVSIN